MKNLKKIGLGLLVMSWLILFACNNPRGKKESQNEVIKIGAILPLTGNLSFLGVPQKNAMELAQEFFNKTASKKIEIVFQDNKGNATEAVNIANKMINIDRIKFFITFPTAANQAIKPVIESNNGLLFALSFYPPLVENTKNVLRIFYNADSEAQILSNDLRNKLIKNSRIVIVRSTDAVTEYETKQFLIPRLSQFSEFVFDVPFSVGDKDIRNIILKAKSNNPDAIIVLGFGSDFPNILKEINIQFSKKPFMSGGIGFLEAVDLIDDKNLLKDVKFVIPSFLLEADNKNFEDISKLYKEKFKTSITYDGVYSFDNIGILNKALNNSTSHASPEEIRNFIINMKTYDGLEGQIEFFKDGNAIVPQTLVEYSLIDKKIIKVNY